MSNNRMFAIISSVIMHVVSKLQLKIMLIYLIVDIVI